MHGRGWFQFSLRSCLLLVTAISVWLGWHVRIANRQKEAIKAIEGMGGSVLLDDDGKTPIAVLVKPHLIKNANGTVTLPPGYRSGLITVGPKITLTDEGLRHVAALPTLEIVAISGVPITDAGLERLRGMKKLHLIRLGHTSVTASAVAEFQKACPNCAIEVWP